MNFTSLIDPGKTIRNIDESFNSKNRIPDTLTAEVVDLEVDAVDVKTKAQCLQEA